MKPGADPRQIGLEQGADSEDEHHDDGCCHCINTKHDAEPGGFVDHDREDSSGVVKAKCTDLLCLIIFILAMVGLGYVIQYSQEHGDLRRLYHGYNFLGELCGVEGKDADGNVLYNNTDKPMLYWCSKECTPGGLDTKCLPDETSSLGGSKLDLEYPVCRPSCPTFTDALPAAPVDPNTVIVPNITAVVDPNNTVGTERRLASTYSCYDRMTPGTTSPLPGLAGSYAKTNQYHFREQQDYKAKKFMFAYCVPEDQSLFDELIGYIKQQPAMQMVVEAANLKNAWPLFLGAAVAAVLLGFIYLFIINKFACCLVYSSMVILDILPLAAGGILCYKFSMGGMDGIPGTGDATYDLVIGIIFIILGIVFVIMSFCLNDAILTAVRVVQATSECIIDLPSLLFEPVITQSIRLVMFFGLLVGLMHLLSCGQISTMSLEQFALLDADAGINGVFRTFTYTEDEWYLIGYYVFVIFWIMCLCTALSQFSLAWAVQYWYFTPYAPEKELKCCPVLKGYCIGTCFHLGSLAFGSFLIATLMFIRMILSFIARQAKGADNPAVATAASALNCCLTCFQRCVEFINKNAYMDIALNHTSFCFAARNAVTIIVKNFPQIAMLNGACWVFEMAGVGSITAGGVGLVYLAVEKSPQYSDRDSEMYISDPIVVLIVTGLICFMISYSFMQVYDMVADTVLYCKCNEEIRRRKGSLPPDVRYAPAMLDKMIEGRDHSGSSSGED